MRTNQTLQAGVWGRAPDQSHQTNKTAPDRNAGLQRSEQEPAVRQLHNTGNATSSRIVEMKLKQIPWPHHDGLLAAAQLLHQVCLLAVANKAHLGVNCDLRTILHHATQPTKIKHAQTNINKHKQITATHIQTHTNKHKQQATRTRMPTPTYCSMRPPADGASSGCDREQMTKMWAMNKDGCDREQM